MAGCSFGIGRFRSAAACTTLLLLMICGLACIGLGQSPEHLASVHGLVRDSLGHPIAGAAVHLLSGATTRSTTHTDSWGAYEFSGLSETSYKLRVEKPGYDAAIAVPVVLHANEVKTVDLTLNSTSAMEQRSSSSTLPEFFDNPQFKVAGVTQATNAGGHGSDVVRRSAEALTKETASLGGNSDGSLTSVVSSGAEGSLRDTVERQPADFQANYQLGHFLASQGRASEGIPYLEHAAKLQPSNYGNCLELARAYAAAGDLEKASTTAKSLQAKHDRAELHHLLGEIEEKQGNSREAVRQYQRAAELDPSEPNFFDWGTEFLKHRGVQPAIEVFTKGNALFPQSVRMLIALGVAWFDKGDHDQAAKYLFAASDLQPNNPLPYMFLGKMLNTETAASGESVEKMERFVRLHPENALANYYCAVSLRKRSGHMDDADNSAQVESLLRKAVQLDAKLAAGYLQLGILYSDRKDFPSAISAYQKAIEADPKLEETHYRLAQLYRRTGEKEKAQQQIALYEKLSKENTQQVERERSEIQQFVFALRDGEPASRRQENH